jgi:glycosyltransferase involved in cell wall biosynthesis
MQPYISICIPSYQRVNYLKRLLNSIAIQTFSDFEVIVSDDSPDSSVQDLLINYQKNFIIRYFKNQPAFGPPANWNFGISKAEGEWIKIMHDDDWFATSKSLQIFTDRSYQKKKFIFSAYTNYFEDDSTNQQQMFMPSSWGKKILKEPNVLLAKNVIGPPSVTMLHKSIDLRYDERLKWRVDMEYYIRILQEQQSFEYINQSLINVSVSESQVTQSCIYNPSVELPEGFILLEKHGINSLKNIWVYDAWWRLLRNMHIRDEKELRLYKDERWPQVIIKMLKHLNKVPDKLLKNGVISKTAMSISHLFNKPKNW